MEFEKFKQTDFYKNSQATVTVLEHFYFFVSILILLSPLWGYLFKEWAGLAVGVLFTLITTPFWVDIFTKKISLSLKSFVRSLVVVMKTKSLRYSVVVFINLLVFFRYTLNTKLPTYAIIVILFVLYGIAFLTYHLKPKFGYEISKFALYLLFLPTAFNLPFVINSGFSDNPTTEVYRFSHRERWYGSKATGWRLERIAYIDLTDSKYEEYHWFRMFFDFEAMKFKSEVAYTFEDGLFGVKVLKHYEFGN